MESVLWHNRDCFALVVLNVKCNGTTQEEVESWVRQRVSGATRVNELKVVERHHDYLITFVIPIGEGVGFGAATAVCQTSLPGRIKALLLHEDSCLGRDTTIRIKVAPIVPSRSI